MTKRARLDRLAPRSPYPPDSRSDADLRRQVADWLDGGRPPDPGPPRRYDRAAEQAAYAEAHRAVLALLDREEGS